MKKRRSIAQEQAQREQRRTRRTRPLRRLVYGWWDRIFGAAREGSWSEAEERYGSGQTTKDFVFNTAGLTAWGMMFPVFTILITQLLGTEQAGMFSLAFVTGNVLMIIATYGVRPYQCSDIEEKHSFKDYAVARWITCAVMLVVGLAYVALRGFAAEMFAMMVGVFVFRMVDGLADVYEGRLQQADKLYLAGISQTVRSAVPFVVFAVTLFVFRSLPVSTIAFAVTAIAAFALVTMPLAKLETPKSGAFNMKSVTAILRQCFPLFLGLFLYTFIDNMPKFAMDGVLDYSSQLYFNALYFPAQMILLVGGFVYKPLIVRMASAWQDERLRHRFDLFIAGMFAVIFAITVVMLVLFAGVGVQLLSFMYGVDFEPMRGMCYLMLVAGGITGGIDFLYQVCAIIRHQRAIARLYVIAFVVSLVVPLALIHLFGLMGAVIGYLVEMLVLFGLLMTEYVRVRLGYAPSDSDPRPIMAGR